MERTFDTKVRASLSELIKRARSVKNEQNLIIDEVEFRFGSKEKNYFNTDHTIVEFQKMLAYLRTNYPIIDGINDEQKLVMLDINIENSEIPELDNLRIGINGPEDFNMFCIQNNLNELHNTVFERKKRISNVDVQDFSFMRLSASTESNIYVPEDNTVAGIPLTEINNLLNSSRIQKFYRLKKRYIYFITIDDNSDYRVRVDMTEVRQAGGYSLKNSKVKELKPRYEIEVEVVGKIDTQNPGPLINNNHLISFIGLFAAAYKDTSYDFLLTDMEKKSILDNYFNIFYKNKDTSDMKKFPKKYFVGTDIRPVEHKHVVLSEGKTQLVKEQYSVSVKADGQRKLLFLRGEDENVYVIDSGLNVSKLGTLSSQTAIARGEYYLVDGEHVETKLGNSVFLCFDIIYARNKDVRSMMFFGETKETSRYHIMNSFVNTTKLTSNAGEETTTIRAITYKRLTSAKSLTEFNEGLNVDYETDGLIFTPSGKYPESITDNENIRLKWKPAEMQSIDFKLKMEKIDNYKYNVIQTSNGPKIYASLTYISKKEYPTFTVKDRPDISKIALDVNENGKPVFENKIIENGTIAECVFLKGVWQIMRLRLDKKEPNGTIAVFSNWKLIVDPITMAELTGTIIKDRTKLAIEPITKVPFKAPKQQQKIEKVLFVPSQPVKEQEKISIEAKMPVPAPAPVLSVPAIVPVTAKKLVLKTKKKDTVIPEPVMEEAVPEPVVAVPEVPVVPDVFEVPEVPEVTYPVVPVVVEAPDVSEPDYSIDMLRQKIKAALKRTDKLEKLTPLIAQNRLVSTGEYTKEGLKNNKSNVEAAVKQLKQ